jgi:hypothetical protein
VEIYRKQGVVRVGINPDASGRCEVGETFPLRDVDDMSDQELRKLIMEQLTPTIVHSCPQYVGKTMTYEIGIVPPEYDIPMMAHGQGRYPRHETVPGLRCGAWCCGMSVGWWAGQGFLPLCLCPC